MTTTSKQVITHNFRHSVAENFSDSFSANNTSYYLFIGKPISWNVADIPPDTNTAFANLKDAWDSIMSLKRIGGDSVRLVVPRVDWSSNTVYKSYDDKNPTYFSNTSTRTYVLTSNNEVYKCIKNNFGALSTVEPSGTNSNNGFIKTADGYVWKYMYRIGDIENDNLFLSLSYMPVPTTPTATLVSGTIDDIILANTPTGTGYNSSVAANGVSIVTITGDGSGATATANVGANGAITGVTVISSGSGYTYANVSFNPGISGIGALATAILSPTKGHAFNPALELNAKDVFLAMRIGNLDSTEGGNFSIQNDFRQFGIIKNPYKYGTTEIAEANSYSQTIDVTCLIDSNPSFSIDDYVFQTNASGNTSFYGYVVDVSTNANNSLVRLTNTQGTIQAGQLLFNTNAATSKRVQSYETLPLEKYSGQIIYFENISKVQRNNNQAEVFKVLFDF